MTLEGKVAIVTGGNSGIGKAIVLELAAQGASVVVDYVSHPEATEALEKQLAALGDDKVIGVEADVSKVADLQRLIDKSVEAFGRVDIMVNNAGVETRTDVLSTTEEQYDFVMNVNLKSAFFGTQIAAKQMIAQGDGGAIIRPREDEDARHRDPAGSDGAAGGDRGCGGVLGLGRWRLPQRHHGIR